MNKVYHGYIFDQLYHSQIKAGSLPSSGTLLYITHPSGNLGRDREKRNDELTVTGKTSCKAFRYNGNI